MRALSDPSKRTRPTILLIAEDVDVYPYLKKNLRQRGYGVLMAVDVEDALEWIGGGYVNADIVMVDLVGRTTEEALTVGREVRQHAKYNGHTPLIGMAEKYDKKLEGTDVNVEGNDWIHYLGEEPDQLKKLLARLTSSIQDLT